MICVDKYGHLFSTRSLKELVDFAAQLNIEKEKNHIMTDFVCFWVDDIQKEKAIELGAFEVESQEINSMIKESTHWIKKILEQNKGIVVRDPDMYKKEVYRINFDKLKNY